MLFGVCLAADQLLAVLVNGQVAGRPVPSEAVDRPETFLRLHHGPHVQIYVAGPDRAHVMAGGSSNLLGMKLADIDAVNDVAPEGSNDASNPTALRSVDGRFTGFIMPSSSGFIHKWHAAI